MKEITQLARNVSYLKDKEGEFLPFVEIIVVTTEPAYELTNTGDTTRTRKCETLRFGSLLTGIEHLRDYLNDILDEFDDSPEGEQLVVDEKIASS